MKNLVYFHWKIMGFDSGFSFKYLHKNIIMGRIGSSWIIFLLFDFFFFYEKHGSGVSC